MWWTAIVRAINDRKAAEAEQAQQEQARREALANARANIYMGSPPGYDAIGQYSAFRNAEAQADQGEKDDGLAGFLDSFKKDKEDEDKGKE